MVEVFDCENTFESGPTSERASNVWFYYETAYCKIQHTHNRSEL
jgi:hypothetical protein